MTRLLRNHQDTGRLPRLRSLALTVGIVGLLLPAAASARPWAEPSGAAPPDAAPVHSLYEKDIPLRLVIEIVQFKPHGCGHTAYMQFADVKGATSYQAHYDDTYYGPDQVATGPPFPQEGKTFDVGKAVPKGQHRIGITGGTSSGDDCSDATALWSARLKALYAVAILSKPNYGIAGTVTTPDGSGVGGVSIVADGPKTLKAKTKPNGHYRIDVPKKALGKYTVTPSSKDAKFKPRSKKVTVTKTSVPDASFVVEAKGALDVKAVVRTPVLDIPDTPEADAPPVQSFVDVTIKNTGKSDLTGVSLARELKIKWDVDGVKAPKPLPVVQNGPPAELTADTLAPGESVKGSYLVSATGDGEFQITAKANATNDDKKLSADGKDRLRVRTPALFFYAHKGRVVPSPDAAKLVAAGTAFAIRIKLVNRSYKDTLVVNPFAASLSGNAAGGYVVKADAPIQVGAAVESLDAVQGGNFYVLKPREERELDAVVRTRGSDATGQMGGGGTRARVGFEAPTVSRYNEDKNKLEKVDPDRVVLAAGAAFHEISIDDSAPATVPLSYFDATVAFSYGAALGLWNSTAGMARGLFVDLPTLVVNGSWAFVQTQVERQAEMWRALKESKGLHEAFDTALTKQMEFALRDFDKLTKLPAGIKSAYEKANEDTAKKFDKIAKQWYSGDWHKAAQEMGEVAGQTAGDIALADVAFAKALSIVPRLGRVAKAVDLAALAKHERLRPAVEAFTNGAVNVKRAMGFLDSSRVVPGFIFKFSELKKLYGLSRKQSEFLAEFCKRNKVIVAVRSRGAGALKWVEKFGAYVKPEWIKIKNVNHMDVEYLRFAQRDLDRVAINKSLPTEGELDAILNSKGITDPVERAKVQERRKLRQEELDTDEPGYVKDLETHATNGTEIESDFNWKDNGLDPAGKGPKTKAKFQFQKAEPPQGAVVINVSVDGGKYVSVTGDVDLVSMTHADNTPLSPAEHLALLEELRGPPMYIQHPETATWNKKGEFNFDKKHSELSKDNPVQFAPDGQARMVTYDRLKSCFTSNALYTVFWLGGYRGAGRFPMPTGPAVSTTGGGC